MNKNTIVIVDSVGSDSQIVARKIRDMKVYCEVFPYNANKEKLQQAMPIGFVVVGEKALEQVQAFLKVPVFKFDIEKIESSIQKTQLHTFLFESCKAKDDWTSEKFIEQQIEEIRKTVGNKKVLCALSGGVDSSVTAVLLQKAIGNQLNCVFVNQGMMRKGEPEYVEKVFKDGFNINLKCIDAEDRFLEKLKGVTEPETKRKIIGEEFIRVFEEQAKLLGEIGFLAQGTIYPDIIESGVGAQIVKSHHNVGGIPANIDFEGLVEPLKYLFKDEARRVGEALGIPKELVWRQPFPGPGLAVRCMGELTKPKLDLLREADAIFTKEVENAQLKIWQYFAVLTDIKSVGVTDSKRTYSSTIALRAVNSVDAMSATSHRIPYEVLEKVVQRITSEVEGVNRVVFDITPKPPATIEWE